MPPRRRVAQVDLPPRPEPWWHAHRSVLVALCLALAGGWLESELREAVEEDRIERRLAELEDRCR